VTRVLALAVCFALAVAPAAMASDRSLRTTITETVAAVNAATTKQTARSVLEVGRLRLKLDTASTLDGRVARVLAMNALTEMLAVLDYKRFPGYKRGDPLPSFKAFSRLQDTRFKQPAANIAMAGQLVGLQDARIKWRELALRL
jgi:hypothetical protein